jgi:hypothetical protein
VREGAIDDIDRQLEQEFAGTLDLHQAEPAAPLGDEQGIRDVERPNRRNQADVTPKVIEQRDAVASRLGFDAPRERHRRIDHQRRYIRPSSISSRIEIPSSEMFSRRRYSWSASMASFTFGFIGPGGRNSATGTPCFVIVTVSPRATSSRS